MKRFLHAALPATLFAASCFAQTGTVVFYSKALSAKSEAEVLLPKSEQPFGGLQGDWIFDGAQHLARVRMGRFAIFHLHPGEHSFTSLAPAGPDNKPLVIDIKAGGQYCLRLYEKMINVYLYAGWENQIEEVPCQRAQADTAHLKPIQIKQVDPAFRSEFDPGATFPGEASAQK